MFEILPQIGAAVTALLGLMGLVSPKTAARITSLQPDGLIGLSEIRATYGGFFLGIGGAALYFQQPALFLGLGVAWVATALGRLLSVFIDDSRAPKNFFGVVFEALIGVLCLATLGVA